MPRIMQRSVLIPVVLVVLTIFQPGSSASRAEDPGHAVTTPVAASAAPLPVVMAIDVLKIKAGTQITISGEGKLTYEYFVIGGKSLLIDIPGASSKVLPAERQVDDEFVSRIQVAEHSGEKPGVRVALALKKPDDFTVSGENGRIVIAFAIRKDSASPSQPPLNRVAEVTATRIANAFRVAVKTDAKPVFRVLESADPKKVTVAIDSSRLEPNSRTTSEYSSPDTPVTRISSWSEPKDPTVVLVAIDLRQPLPFRVFTDGNDLNIDFSSPVPDKTETVPPLPVSSALTPGATPSAPSAPPAFPAATVADPSSVPGKYVGNKITLEFLDADLMDIFRLIADVSGMNIVATDDVKGKRSVKMNDVPWDQALELVLKTNNPQLEQIADGENVIRIVTLARLMQERSDAEKKKLEALRLEEDSRKLERWREDALLDEKVLKAHRLKREGITAKAVREPLKEYTIALNNSEVTDVWPNLAYYLQQQEIIQVKGALLFSDNKEAPSVTHLENTPKGFYYYEVPMFKAVDPITDQWRIVEENCPNCQINIDKRTKTMFFKMYPLYMEKVLYIVNTLDAPKKIDSVLIEARIVEVVSGFSQTLGIQWGGTFKADPAHGNATRYAFPNSIDIGGTQPGNYLVNLPAAGAVGGIGLSLGHISDTLSLDVKLSALESMGKTKILSNPKILTLNNKSAKINIGDQLPIPKTDTEGNRTVEWKDVGILLDVTPEITSDNKVVMKVNIEKSSQGQTVPTTEGDMFSIVRRGAETNVIVADGETTVIGGIYIQSDRDNTTGLPGFSKIPLLGWLFKSRSKNTDRTELMIFLTPKINRYR